MADSSSDNKMKGDGSCCPPGSMGPATVLFDRPLQGTMVEIPAPSRELVGMQPLPCYCTGVPLAKAERIIVVFTDVYGIDAGHHKVFADCLADRLGKACPTSVVIPDLFRGVPILQPWLDNSNMATDIMGSLLGAPGMVFRLRQYPPAKVEQEIFQMILPFLQSQLQNTSAKLSCVGFCFGGWVVGRILGHQHQAGDSSLSFQCGVGIHPSFQPNLLHAETQTSMAERIRKPILFLPAWNDVDLKPETKLVNVIEENLALAGIDVPEISVEFPDMVHGWMSRGDPTDPKVAAEQERALQLTVDFIEKYSQ